MPIGFAKGININKEIVTKNKEIACGLPPRSLNSTGIAIVNINIKTDLVSRI